MMRRSMKVAMMAVAVSLFAGAWVVPVKAEVTSSLDTAEESFFDTPASGTSTEMNSSTDSFFDNAEQGGASTPVNPPSEIPSVPSTSVSDTPAPSTPATSTETVTTTSNSNNTYNYYYTTTPSTTEAEKSEQITLNGTVSQEEVTDDVVSLKKPQIATVVSKKKAAMVVLSKAVSGADGYQIQLCKSKTFSKKNVIQLRTVLTAKTVNVTSAGTYYVRVRAYKIVNGKATYSSWSAVKTVKIK